MNMNKICASLVAAAFAVCAVVPVVPAYATDITTVGGTGQSAVVLTVDAPTFSVTVPTNLAISVASDGTVTTATDAVITNLSHGMVRVTDVDLVAQGDWAIIDFDTDLSTTAVDTKQVGMEINGDKSDADVEGKFAFTQSNWADIGAVGSADNTLDIDYDAVLPAQSVATTDATIANVVFTIGWATSN